MRAKVYVRRESCTCSHDLIKKVVEKAFDYLEYKYGLKIEYELVTDNMRYNTVEINGKTVVEFFENSFDIIKGFEKFLLKNLKNHGKII